MARGYKTGGRAKGTPNKLTQEFRGRVQLLLDDNWEKLIDDFENLTSKERIDSMLKLLEYCLPKLSRNEFHEVSDINELLRMSPQERKDEILRLKQIINP